MATKKKIIHKKDAPRELIVLVPCNWGLTDKQITDLRDAFQQAAKDNVDKTNGPVTLVSGVTNGHHKD